MNNQTISKLLFLCLAFSACRDKPQNLAVPKVELAREVTTNASYGADERKKMDIYLPAKRGNSTPFILLLHGGAWIGGDKRELTALQDSLCNRGIASANINYRFASASVHIEDLMADVAEALSYSKNNAAKWALNLDKIAIGGVSSGAQLAMMFAFKYDTNGAINCVISGAGPTMIDDRNFLNGAVAGNGIIPINFMVGAVYIGGDIDPRFTQASPIKNLKNLPLLTIHGNADQVVPYQHSVAIDAAMGNAGYPHQLVTLQGVNHDLNLSLPANATTVYQAMDRWIKTYEK